MNAGRRTLLRVLAAAALPAIPTAGIGASARVRRLGVMWDEPGAKEVLPLLFKELAELGLVEGRDFVVQLCAVEDRNESTPGCAATLVRAQCDVIFTVNTRNTRALQRATSTIPIVTSVADPVGSGFASSLARPGANITGMANSDPDIGKKLIELARLVIPRLTGAVVIIGADQEYQHEFAGRMQHTVIESGVPCRLALTDSMQGVEREFRSMRGRGEQLVIAYSIFLGPGTTEAIAQLALRNQLALVSHSAEWVRAGGLLSFSITYRNEFRRRAYQIALIFRGANPAAIPFEQPDTTQIVLNRTTAAKLGIRIPQEMLISATEVIG